MRTIALSHAHQQSRAAPAPASAALRSSAGSCGASEPAASFGCKPLVFFGLVLFVIWVSQMPSQFTLGNANVAFIGFVAGTSAWGLLLNLPTGVLLLLGCSCPLSLRTG